MAIALFPGCSNHRYELVCQVDELLDCPSSEWKEANGNFYYKLPNGALRVKSDGAISLITDLENSKSSMLFVSNPDGARAAKVAKRFGIRKLTRENIDASSELQIELFRDAINYVSNAVKSSVIVENPESPKSSNISNKE